MHWHQLRSHVHQVFQDTPHIVGFRSVLRVVNSIVVAVTIYSIFDLYANSFVEIHTAKKGSFEVLSCHLVSCNSRPPVVKPSANKLTEALEHPLHHSLMGLNRRNAQKLTWLMSR